MISTHARRIEPRHSHRSLCALQRVVIHSLHTLNALKRAQRTCQIGPKTFSRIATIASSICSASARIEVSRLLVARLYRLYSMASRTRTSSLFIFGVMPHSSSGVAGFFAAAVALPFATDAVDFPFSGFDLSSSIGALGANL